MTIYGITKHRTHNHVNAAGSAAVITALSWYYEVSCSVKPISATTVITVFCPLSESAAIFTRLLVSTVAFSTHLSEKESENKGSEHTNDTEPLSPEPSAQLTVRIKKAFKWPFR